MSCKQRPFCDMRPSMQKNCLLQHAKVGQTMQTTYDLPDESFRYGKVVHDPNTVSDCLRWDTRSPDLIRATRRNSRETSPERPQTTRVTRSSNQYDEESRDPRRRRHSPQDCETHVPRTSRKENAIQSPTRYTQPTAKKEAPGKKDFVATNKAALKAGCVTARDFREFQKNTHICVKPEENLAVAEDEFARAVHRSMVHGRPNHVKSEIKDCLTWQGYKEAKEKAIQTREVKSARRQVKASMKPRGIRHTRASRGHTHKPEAPPSYADTFKIKRFRDIEGYAIEDKW